MRRYIRTIGKGILFLLPFFVATAGFLLALHDGLFNAMYRAIRLYMMELDCDYDQVNGLIEIARWTAPVMSAAAIVTILNQFFGSLKNWLRIRKGGAVAIHGDSDYAQFMSEQLGIRAIPGDSAVAMRASSHILLFQDDRDMLSYLSANHKLLRDDSRVYLCTERLVRGNYQNQNLVLCNFAEICARKYWRQFPLRLDRQERNIVIIGFGSYGQQILTQGLLTNIYGREIRLRYHVFGDAREYRSLHTQLEQVASVDQTRPDGDSIWFHSEPWYSCETVLEQADRVILADESEMENLLVLNSIEKYFSLGDIHMKVNSGALIADLWSRARPFGAVEELCTEQCIIDQETMMDAMCIHAEYYKANICPQRETCGAECVHCQAVRADWSRQSTFTIYSNVAQADHFPVKIQILLGDDYRAVEHAGRQAKTRFDALSDTRKLELAEIEHIRWARYHYMNNWRYAPMRDNAKKLHPLLVDFDALSREDQRKDLDAWRNTFALYRGD